MNETLDNLFAKCQQLSDEEFDVLFTALVKEDRERRESKQRNMWNRVINALVDYTNTYGDVIITDNRDGNGVTLAEASFTHTPGLIEVE